MKLAAIILAAGLSSRMGGIKPLMTLGGDSLLAYCARLLRQGGVEEATVVTGLRHEGVAEEARRLGLTVVCNPHYEEGMFSSLLAALPSLAGVDGCFLLPVDIPLVRPATVARLAAAFDGSQTLIPSFQGRPGHPPLLAAGLLPKIAAYRGPGGLQGLLATLPPQAMRRVAVWDRGILLDADTPEDMRVLQSRLIRMDSGESEEVMELARLHMPARGMAHGLGVARAAQRIARRLNQRGASLDIDLVCHAALLHDIAKGMPDHERAGQELLASLGLSRLADIAGAHRQAEPPASGIIGEKEVVALADKLVRGRYRVSVRQRFEEKLDMYRDDREACLSVRRRMEGALQLLAMVEAACGEDVESIVDGGDEP